LIFSLVLSFFLIKQKEQESSFTLTNYATTFFNFSNLASKVVIDTTKISELLSLASEFNANDLLVDLNSWDLITVSDERILDFALCRKIISKAQISIKEQGLNPLCLAQGSLSWERNGKEIQSPIWLIPASFEINKVQNTLAIFPNEEGFILNPFIVKQLQVVYGIQVEAILDFDNLCTFLEEKGFNNLNKELTVLGNFHHHRYEIVRELEELSKMDKLPFGLASLLGIETGDKCENISLPKSELLPADDNQRLAFDSFNSNDLVIHGPPGTGKSQLLTNFIGKLLLGEKSMVVVSEKRSALEVIYQKLESLELESLGFISTPDLSTKDFLKSLQPSWEFYDDFVPSKRMEVSIQREMEANFSLKLKTLSQQNLIGGVSYATFQNLKEGVDLSQLNYRNRLPDLQIIVEKGDLITHLFSLEIQNLVGSIRFTYFENGLLTLHDYLDELCSFSAILEEKFDTKNTNELDVLIQKSISCQLFDHELAQKHSSILVPASQEQKKFIKIAKKFNELQSELKEFHNLSEWKNLPSELELKSIQNQIQHGGFWDKRKAKKRWNELSNLPWSESLNGIERLEKRFSLQTNLNVLMSKFTSQNIHEPKTEIPQILSLIPLFTKEKWETYQSLAKSESENILFFLTKIDRFKSNLKHLFNLNENHEFGDFFQKLKLNFHLLAETQNEIVQLNAPCLEAMRDEKDYSSFLRTVLGSHFSDFKNKYPILSEFEMRNLGKEIDAIIESGKQDQAISIEQIHTTVFEKFKKYQRLLSTPASKLNEQEKRFRVELKKGKALLVKEFGKTKSHPSLRELFSSEARHWIAILKPVWLSNTAQLAKSFPLVESIFDVCIFDEASQIPLQNGVGALYRSKRIIIAGDEQQMGPTNYFKSGSEDQTSLLQHANFYLKRVALKHHYRSAHPALIEFSNTHFYNNDLVVFPSFPLDLSPISYHYVENGTFVNRRNNPEAKKAVELIQKSISEKESIGIVAFSQEQIDCIWENMDEYLKSNVERRIDNNTLFIKPLEKVQGDECEFLIISMAYAKDVEGNFAMRFGPLNLASGRNRLNVLFSRASKKIAFITSILPEEMKLSENESVNLLRNWLRFSHTSAQKLKQDYEITFPFNLKPTIEKHELTFSNIHEDLNSANEMITLHRVLKQRAWKINYK